MNKDKLLRIMLINYIIVFIVSLSLSTFNIFTSLMVSLFMMFTFIPYGIGKYIKYKKINLKKLEIKYACYKSRKIIFQMNIILFLFASLQIVYILEQNIIESFKIFLVSYPFFILFNYLFTLNKSVCVVNILNKDRLLKYW